MKTIFQTLLQLLLFAAVLCACGRINDKSSTVYDTDTSAGIDAGFDAGEDLETDIDNAGSAPDSGIDSDTEIDTESGTSFNSDSEIDTESGTNFDSESEIENVFQPEYAKVFSESNLPDIEIILSEEAVSHLKDDPFTYQSGAFHYISSDGQTPSADIDNVGIRLKGRASFQSFDGKPAFKIKFNEFDDGKRFLGLRRLTLNNMVQDPSMMHERIGYSFFRAAGIPAPRCNHARVFVNGEYYGLYANVETMDKTFIREHWGKPDGNLYDISNDHGFVDFTPNELTHYVLETNKRENDISDLAEAIEMVNGPREDFLVNTEKVFDMDEVLLVGATQAILADWDGYFGAQNNYKIYHTPVDDRFVMLPWGIDQCMRNSGIDYKLDGSSSQRRNGRLFTKCKKIPECYQRYLNFVIQALETWETLPLEALLDQIWEQIEESAQQDTRRPDKDIYRNKEQLRKFLNNRASYVKAEFCDPQETCCTEMGVWDPSCREKCDETSEECPTEEKEEPAFQLFLKIIDTSLRQRQLKKI